MSYTIDYKSNLMALINDDTVFGWCQPEKAIDLYDRVVEEEAKLVVELGVFGGKSLVALGLGAKKLGNCKVIGIDPWKHDDALNETDGANRDWWAAQDLEAVYHQAKHVMNRAMLSGVVQLMKRNSVDALEHIGDDIDVLHIDGNHSEWDSCRDVLNWLPKVKPGGVIYMDDEDWVSTKKAQEFLASKCTKVSTIKTTNECGVYRKN